MEHKINAGGQSVTITDEFDTLELELSEEFESEIVEDKPAEIVHELQLLAEFGF